MMANTYRIAEIFAEREGYTAPDGTVHRYGIDGGDLAGAIMLAARRGPTLGKRADLVDYVFVADGAGIWGAGRAVAIANRPLPDGGTTRCFIVDPYGVPKDVLKFVGEGRPNPTRGGSGRQYGTIIDGVLTMDAKA